MILGQISYLDCIVFLISLIPQLLYKVSPIQLLRVALEALPFVLFQLPYQYISERYFIPEPRRSPYVRQATYFQDLVIRIVRYAFANVPASVGRVFFSKNVALPFMRFRMLRHGYWDFPLPIHETQLQDEKSRGSVKGIWVNYDPESQHSLDSDDTSHPDIVVYYCHGGGFSMGSNWFYMEFLIAWIDLLKQIGYRHPAIFAPEYDLVPDSIWPKQRDQVRRGYSHVCSVTQDSSRVCVAGDSAGATLILSLLLGLAESSSSGDGGMSHNKPGLATLISPWCTINSPLHRNTSSDFLNASTLHTYGLQYAGSTQNLSNPLISPGTCEDLSWWSRASPKGGFCITYGSEEVFGPDIQQLVARLRKANVAVSVREEPGAVHAWPVVALFLGDTQAERQKGLKDLVGMIRRAIDP